VARSARSGPADLAELLMLCNDLADSPVTRSAYAIGVRALAGWLHREGDNLGAAEKLAEIISRRSVQMAFDIALEFEILENSYRSAASGWPPSGIKRAQELLQKSRDFLGDRHIVSMLAEEQLALAQAAR
jgi:hypothetical protein